MDVKTRRCKFCGLLIALVPVEGQGYEACRNGQVPYVRDPQSRTTIINSYGQRVRGRQVRETRDADGFGWLLHYGECRQRKEMNELMKQQETLFPPLRPV